MVRSSTFALAIACAMGGCLFPTLDTLTLADAALDSPNDIQPSGDVDNGDVLVVDAGVTDGGVESGVPFCASHANTLFCADFDEIADAAAGFTNPYVSEGGVLGLDTTTSSSLPASLVIGNVALSSSQSAHGAEYLTTPTTATGGVTLDLDMQVDALASEGTYIEALALVFVSPTRSSIQLNLKAASTEVGEEVVALDGGKTYTPHTFSTQLPMSTWVHVTIAVALQAPRTISVKVGSDFVVDHAPMSASFANGSIDLYCGNAYSPGPSSGATIHYDNVLLQSN